MVRLLFRCPRVPDGGDDPSINFIWGIVIVNRDNFPVGPLESPHRVGEEGFHYIMRTSAVSRKCYGMEAKVCAD